MTMKVRALLVGMVMLAEMWLVGCGHYNCGTTFGNSSCSGGNGGLSQGGGGTVSGTYVLIADAGRISGEVLDPTTGSFSITPGFGTVSVNTNNPGDWMVLAGGHVYTGYTDIGAIYGWTVNGNGTVTAISTVQNLTAAYLLNDISAGTQAMIANPNGTLLFALDQGTEEVNVYQIGTGGTLSSPSVIQLPSGFKPYNLAIDGKGKYLYVSNIVGSATTQVAAYSISGSTLTVVQGSPLNSSVQQMQGEASGTYMIGTSATDMNISVLKIQSDGTLGTPILKGSTDFPVTVAVQPNTGGNLVYAVDFNGDVEGFTLDASTGALNTVSGSPFGIGGVEAEFDPIGKYLFVEVSTNQASNVMDVFDVSASPQLSTITGSVGWADGAWQPFDVQ